MVEGFSVGDTGVQALSSVDGSVNLVCECVCKRECKQK